MRRYRIVSDGERFKVEVERWFLLWWWDTLREDAISIDGCGGGPTDIVFESIGAAKEYVKRLSVKWSVVDGPYAMRQQCHTKSA